MDKSIQDIPAPKQRKPHSKKVANPPSNDELREMYCIKKYSKPDIAGLYETTVHHVDIWMKKAGIPTRSKLDAVHAAGEKIRNALRGLRHKPISPDGRANISAARRKWVQENAKGISAKTNRYVEHTIGEHAGRGVHVVLMEQHIGRLLTKDEIVHHRDENKQNNCLDNLQLMTRSEHMKHHRKEQKERGTGNVKLTNELAEKIRARHAVGDISYRKLGNEFGFHNSYVWKIVNEEIWL